MSLFGRLPGDGGLGKLDPGSRQALNRHIQLAGHGPQGKQALFGLVQLVGFEIKSFRGQVYGGGGFLRLDQGPVNGRGRRGQARYGLALFPG